MPSGRASREVIAAALVAALVLVGAFGYYYTSSSKATSLLSKSITSQSSLLGSQAAQLTEDENRIRSLNATVSSLKLEVANLQSQVEINEANITKLVGSESQANATIGHLNLEISSLNVLVSNLDAQISALNSRIAEYQSQIASLQIELSPLLFTIGAVDDALYWPCTGAGSVVNGSMVNVCFSLSDYNFTVAKGSMENFTFTAAADAGFLLVAVINSTSANTTVNCLQEPAFGYTGSAPVNVGRSGIAVVTPEAFDTYTVNIYDQNLKGFSATVSIWYFS
jgi:uncharacterized coiled-coil protein SlyX